MDSGQTDMVTTNANVPVGADEDCTQLGHESGRPFCRFYCLRDLASGGNILVSVDRFGIASGNGANPVQLLAADLAANTNRTVDTGIPASHTGLRFSADSRFLVPQFASFANGPLYLILACSGIWTPV